MSVSRTTRPVVRSFLERFAGRAATWVSEGGHAVVWEGPRRARLVFPVPVEGDLHDLGAWSVYDLGKRRWTVEKQGPFRGLATSLVPPDCLWIVKRRIERDSIHPKATRRVAFDCLECGACCKDNDVALEPADVARIVSAGRPELVRPPLARRARTGLVHLRLLPDGRCRHLGRDNKCGIYSIRPGACSEFPVASECCLYAREDELGLIDGAEPATPR